MDIFIFHNARVDAAQWITAGETAFGWTAGTFLAAYRRNISGANSTAIEASPVGDSIMALMTQHVTWEGSYTELLEILGRLAGEKMTSAKTWPKAARGLSGAIERVRPNLRRAGIEITEIGRDSASRRHMYRITQVSAVSSSG